MTVDIDFFAELLNELAGYFNKSITPFVRKAWYKKLGSQLTNEQFAIAVEQAITSKQFMPTAEELIEAIRGNFDIVALEEWDKCLLAASRGDREVVSTLSPAGQVALKSVGGIHALGQSEEKDHQWLQKKFINIWKSVPVEQRPALPVGEEQQISPPAEIHALTNKMSMNGNGKK